MPLFRKMQGIFPVSIQQPQTVIMQTLKKLQGIFSLPSFGDFALLSFHLMEKW